MPKYALEDERISHGKFGVVEDDENLIRILYEPEHIRDGVLLEAAIPLEDLKERGFSLDREAHVKSKIVEDRIKTQKAKNPGNRQRDTKSVFRCINIRNIIDCNGIRLCIVLDSPSKSNPAHASLYGIKCSGSELRKIRGLLIPALQEGLQSLD
jgi:hypothetical protein